MAYSIKSQQLLGFNAQLVLFVMPFFLSFFSPFPLTQLILDKTL